MIVRAARPTARNRRRPFSRRLAGSNRGKPVIDAVPGPALAEGRPVYVVNPPPK